MLTIFSIPKPFCGHTKIIQTNAIHSWTILLSECEIILFGNEEGTDDIATKFSITHIPTIKRNEFGTPLISDAFSKAKEIAKYKKLAYVNSDIILINDFTKAIEKIKDNHLPHIYSELKVITNNFTTLSINFRWIMRIGAFLGTVVSAVVIAKIIGLL